MGQWEVVTIKLETFALFMGVWELKTLGASENIVEGDSLVVTSWGKGKSIGVMPSIANHLLSQGIGP